MPGKRHPGQWIAVQTIYEVSIIGEEDVKQVISISLGASKDDYQFETEFLGQQFMVRRIGTDGSRDIAAEKLLEYDKQADAIGLGNIKFPKAISPGYLTKKHDDKIKTLGKRIQTPVTTGAALRDVSFEWSLRFVEHKFGNYFKNARVLFLSGMTSYRIAKVMAEYTDNLTFADPVIENDISKLIHSLSELEKYARGAHEILEWLPGKRLTSSVVPLQKWNQYVLKKAMQKATILVVPSYNFYKYLKDTSIEELGGKIIITSTAYDDRVEFLKARGVDVIIDTTPKILERVVAPNVIEALILAALGKKTDMIHPDDLLEIISMQKMDPRVVYPVGSGKTGKPVCLCHSPLVQRVFEKRQGN